MALEENDKQILNMVILFLVHTSRKIISYYHISNFKLLIVYT